MWPSAGGEEGGNPAYGAFLAPSLPKASVPQATSLSLSLLLGPSSVCASPCTEPSGTQEIYEGGSVPSFRQPCVFLLSTPAARGFLEGTKEVLGVGGK